MTYYDDNFGCWEGIEDPDMLDFYHEVQQQSVEKKCGGCGQTVRLRPDYVYCHSCTTVLERGGDLG